MRATPPEQTEARSSARSYSAAHERWLRARGWLYGLIRSFGYAFTGIAQLIRRQRNAQIHVFVTVVLLVVSWAWGLSRFEWMILILTIALVLAMEAINTAIEAVVDLATPDFHPLAKQAKDVAAGGVLLTAIGAALVALLLFGQRLLNLLGWLVG